MGTRVAAPTRSARVERAALRAVYARPDGRIFDLPKVGAAVDVGAIEQAQPHDFIPMPPGTLLLRLPARAPVGYVNGKQTVLDRGIGGHAAAVAAALPLGYTRLALPAYAEQAQAPPLPLYGYTAVAWSADGFAVAAARTDELETWSPQAHADDRVRQGIAQRTREFPGSALIKQLARCATEYNCFTAQNVFLRKGEAALPVSPACNARCVGCISAQEPDSGIRSAQQRIRTRPAVDEICAVTLAHLKADPAAIVSFGQGCEGEPLLAADLVEASIRRIRSATGNGTIHCNTNASRPRALTRLIDAGLQSIRVSLNSLRPEAYAAYYRPQGYGLEDVVESVRMAASRGVAVSLNLLTHPGVTDSPEETAALERFLREHPIHMLQTRTLNVDPQRYFAAVGRPESRPYGMRNWLAWLKREFPLLKVGNFTRGFG